MSTESRKKQSEIATHSFWVLEVIIMSGKQADEKKGQKRKEAIIKMRRVIAWADMQMQLKVYGVCMIPCLVSGV